jgi:hypothetical protein
MRRHYRRRLEPKLRAQAGDAVAIALWKAIGILEAHELSPEELAAEAGLDPQKAARRTRKRAADRLERLDGPVRSLPERMMHDRGLLPRPLEPPGCAGGPGRAHPEIALRRMRIQARSRKAR